MNRTLSVIAAAVLMVGLAPATAQAEITSEPSQQTTWHRINGDQSNAAPEHEVLVCAVSADWSCSYSKEEEPALNFHWDGTVGAFHGSDIADSWTCPEWFPRSVCNHTTQVASGQMTYTFTDGSTFTANEELVVSKARGGPALYLHFVDFGFACPWYPTFEKALKSNPIPLPFDGQTWPTDDCVSAP